MKNIFYVLLIIVCCQASAQTPLPYYTGFDNASEKAGWAEHRTGFAGPYNWDYDGFTSLSPPNSIYHDYPVGSSGEDTTSDWFVSPMFDLGGGGMIDSFSFRLYSITGSTTPADEFSIYLLQNSPDPETAVKTELANFTTLASSTANWIDTGGIEIPAAPVAYIAVHYRATNNWFTVNVDNIKISGTGTAIPKEQIVFDPVIFPDPATNGLTIKFTGWQSASYKIFNTSGQVMTEKEDAGEEVSVNVSGFPKGVYFIQLASEDKVLVKSFVKN